MKTRRQRMIEKLEIKMQQIQPNTLQYLELREEWECLKAKEIIDREKIKNTENH